MYILEQDNGINETSSPIAVGRNPFNLAEYAVKYGGLCALDWNFLYTGESYVIKGGDNTVLFWITPILEVSGVGA